MQDLAPQLIESYRRGRSRREESQTEKVRSSREASMSYSSSQATKPASCSCAAFPTSSSPAGDVDCEELDWGGGIQPGKVGCRGQ